MVVDALKIYKEALRDNKELQMRLQNGILPQEGVEVFRRVIAHETPSQLIVSASDIQARLWRAESFLRSEYVVALRSGGQEQGKAVLGTETVQESPPTVLYPRPNLQTAYVAPQNETQQQIADLWQTLLGIEKIGIHDHFVDLGGHSLLGTRLITRLRDTFQVDIPLRLLFEEPTIAHLAMVIVQKKAELVDDALLLQDIEDIEHLTDEEAQTLLAADMMNQTEKV